ncbi:MAG: hypothetical protein M1833_004983 [Piccolia ochrophora]|nr:MAG: hypothetical protein M1833_004983 [Piccolia ochrophora]
MPRMAGSERCVQVHANLDEKSPSSPGSGRVRIDNGGLDEAQTVCRSLNGYDYGGYTLKATIRPPEAPPSAPPETWPYMTPAMMWSMHAAAAPVSQVVEMHLAPHDPALVRDHYLPPAMVHPSSGTNDTSMPPHYSPTTPQSLVQTSPTHAPQPSSPSYMTTSSGIAVNTSRGTVVTEARSVHVSRIAPTVDKREFERFVAERIPNGVLTDFARGKDQGKRSASIMFPTHNEALRAVDVLSERVLEGKKLRVKLDAEKITLPPKRPEKWRPLVVDGSRPLPPRSDGQR